MKLGKKVYLTLALAGLGTFLVVAPAHAQQETDPDHFTLSGVEPFQESTQALPVAPQARSLRARANQLNGKAKLVAANRRAPLRFSRKDRTRLVRERKLLSAETRKTAAPPRRW